MPQPVMAQSDVTIQQPIVLDNGLQFVWEEDHRQPLVAIEARIKGGLRGEGTQVGTGITHFIEHMLFKGTPTRPPGTIEQEVRRYGGTINAFTSFDVTGVTLFVESRYLKEALSLLADILQHATFPEHEFQKERAVVISEIQMNLDDPESRLSQLFWSRHFLEHPYRHPILGYQPLLERLTVKELSEFYAAEYQPQNIVIACAGDLNGDQVRHFVRDLFGAWPRGTTHPEQQLVAVEPPVASTKVATLELPVQAAYITVGFSSVRMSDPALYALDVLANIIGTGRSARLYETLVRQKKVAQVVTAWNYTPYDPGVFGVQLQTDPAQTAGAIDAVLEVLSDVKQHGVTSAELEKAKRSVSTSYLFNRQTVEAKADDLASSLLSIGDPWFSRRYVEGVGRVTREEVQAVAQRYLDPSKMTTAIVRPPQAASPSLTTSSPPGIQVKRTVLDNGVRVITGVDHTLPITSVVIAVPGGVRAEDEAHQGLSNLVAQLLTKGTKQHTALQIAQQVESLGAAVEPFSSRDGLGLSLQLLARDLPTGLDLMHELVSQSTFPEHEVDLQRQLLIKQRQTQEDEIFDVGGRLLRRTLFTQHPYRFNPIGEEVTLKRLTRADCVAFATQRLRPSEMIVAVFGDLDEAAVLRRLRQTIGTLPTGTSPATLDGLPHEQLDQVREVSATLEKEQALIMMGFLGTTYRASDRYALDVLTAILSGMAGRFFQAVREQEGLSYTLGAVNVPGQDPGYVLVYAATRPQERARVLTVLEQELTRVVDGGVTEEELEQAKRYLIGLQRMEVQELGALTRRCVTDELYGIGYEAWRTYDRQINAVTVPMVNAVAKQYLTLQRRAQIVVAPDTSEKIVR